MDQTTILNDLLNLPIVTSGTFGIFLCGFCVVIQLKRLCTDGPRKPSHPFESRGCRGTDSHLLPPTPQTPMLLHTYATHTTATTKLTAQPKVHSAAIQRRTAFLSNTPADSQSVWLHQCFWKGLTDCHPECTLHVDELCFICDLPVYGRAAGWGSFQSKAVLACLLLARLILTAPSNFSSACQRWQQASYYCDWHAPPRGPKYTSGGSSAREKGKS